MSRNKLAQRSDGRFKVNYKDKQFYGKSKKEALRKREEYVALEKAGIDYVYQTSYEIIYNGLIRLLGE